MSQLSSSVVLHLQDCVVRLDVASDFKRRSASHQTTIETFASNSASHPAEALLLCQQTGRKLAKSVRLFTHTCWSGQISLTTEIATALRGDELPQAIAAEAELQSALRPEDTQTHIQAARTGVSTWNVTQCDRNDQEQIEQIATEQGLHIDYLGALPNELIAGPQPSDLAADELLSHLAAQSEEYPTIPADEPRLKSSYRRSLLAALTAAAVIACTMHVFSQSSLATLKTAAMTGETKFKDRKGELDRLSASILVKQREFDTQRELAARKAENRLRLVGARASQELRSARLRCLLDSLSRCGSSGLWINQIDFDQADASEDVSKAGPIAQIRGVAVESTAVAELVGALQTAYFEQRPDDTVDVQLAQVSRSKATETCEFTVEVRFAQPPIRISQTAGGKHD